MQKENAQVTTNTTHTPGPWESIDLQSEEAYLHSNKRIFAKLSSYDEESIDSFAANLALVKAAPALLEAAMTTRERLRDMTTHEYSLGGDKEIRDLLDSVIAKALGVSY